MNQQFPKKGLFKAVVLKRTFWMGSRCSKSTAASWALITA